MLATQISEVTKKCEKAVQSLQALACALALPCSSLEATDSIPINLSLSLSLCPKKCPFMIASGLQLFQITAIPIPDPSFSLARSIQQSIDRSHFNRSRPDSALCSFHSRSLRRLPIARGLRRTQGNLRSRVPRDRCVSNGRCLASGFRGIHGREIAVGRRCWWR